MLYRKAVHCYVNKQRQEKQILSSVCPPTTTLVEQDPLVSTLQEDIGTELPVILLSLITRPRSRQTSIPINIPRT